MSVEAVASTALLEWSRSLVNCSGSELAFAPRSKPMILADPYKPFVRDTAESKSRAYHRGDKSGQTAICVARCRTFQCSCDY